MSTPNPINLNNLDGRYSKPADVAAAISAQAATDAGQYATISKRRFGDLLARFASTNTLPIPAVTTSSDTPTVSWSTSQTVTGTTFGAHTNAVTEIGSRGTWNNTSGYLATGGQVSGLDFFLTGTQAEIRFVCNSSGGQPIWVWVNGAPITVTPDTSQTSTTAGTTYYLKLVFTATARRRIELFVPSITGWVSVTTDYTSSVTPSPRKPVVAFVYDSFGAGSNATPVLQSAPFLISRMLGVECYSVSFGGTGFVSAGSFTIFGSASRVAQVASANPELIVFSGSLNDDGVASSVQAAATSAFAAYTAACPGVPIVAFGPQPSNATSTISANRSANITAWAAAASSAVNMIGYHDMVGTLGGVPVAFATNQTYADATVRTYKGSVWKLKNNGASFSGGGSSPDNNSRWELQTYVYLGTGQVGSTTGDGNRDTYVYSDGVHPTTDASMAMAIKQANLIRSDLLTASS